MKVMLFAGSFWAVGWAVQGHGWPWLAFAVLLVVVSAYSMERRALRQDKLLRQIRFGLRQRVPPLAAGRARAQQHYDEQQARIRELEAQARMWDARQAMGDEPLPPGAAILYNPEHYRK